MLFCSSEEAKLYWEKREYEWRAEEDARKHLVEEVIGDLKEQLREKVAAHRRAQQEVERGKEEVASMMRLSEMEKQKQLDAMTRAQSYRREELDSQVRHVLALVGVFFSTNGFSWLVTFFPQRWILQKLGEFRSVKWLECVCNFRFGNWNEGNSKSGKTRCLNVRRSKYSKEITTTFSAEKPPSWVSAEASRTFSSQDPLLHFLVTA